MQEIVFVHNLHVYTKWLNRERTHELNTESTDFPEYMTVNVKINLMVPILKIANKRAFACTTGFAIRLC